MAKSVEMDTLEILVYLEQLEHQVFLGKSAIVVQMVKQDYQAKKVIVVFQDLMENRVHQESLVQLDRKAYLAQKVNLVSLAALGFPAPLANLDYLDHLEKRDFAVPMVTKVNMG